MLVITMLMTRLKLLNFCTNIENSIEQVLFSGRDVKKNYHGLLLSQLVDKLLYKTLRTVAKNY